MKKLGLSIIVLGLILLGLNSTEAQNKREKFKNQKFVLNELNLTEQQKEKMKEIKFGQEEANIETEAKLKMNKLEIKKLLSNNNFNENELMSLIEKSSSLQLILKKSKVKMWLDIRNILDDKQKDIWLDHFNLYEKNKDRFVRKDKRKSNKPYNNNRGKN